MKVKELIQFLNKYEDENPEVSIFLLKTGKRISLNRIDIEVIDFSQIDINIEF